MSEAVAEYPLAWPTGWPRTDKRKKAAFNTQGREVTYSAAEKRVLDELNRLCGCRAPIISSNMLRTAQPADPGVAVYFQAEGRPMRVIAVDAYTRVEDNIAATIEAMRAIERHGGAEILERAFTGFTALPPPKKCWDVLGVPEGSSGAIVRDAWRKLAAIHHPDKPTGNANRMAEINQARDEALAIVEKVIR